MQVETLIVLLALKGSVWQQDEETKKPQLCIPVEEEMQCTVVPDKLLYDWIKATGTEV